MFWFRRTYGLTPNDPRLLDLTTEEIEADFWAHHFYENPATESGEDEDWDTDQVLGMMESDEWGEWEDMLNERVSKDQS